MRISHYTVLLGFLPAQKPNRLKKTEGRKNGKGNRKRETRETAGLAMETRAWKSETTREPTPQKQQRKRRKEGEEEVEAGRESYLPAFPGASEWAGWINGFPGALSSHFS